MPLRSIRSAEAIREHAPYHLINATLNLVGGSDLATSQRLAAPFLFSARYCGSSDRTGFRTTDKYMDGKLTLQHGRSNFRRGGEPKYGFIDAAGRTRHVDDALQCEAAFWAPTPHRGSWRSRQPRLWPFYTLGEFLSQTDDTGSYCYLTDGGHFDNTGLHSLVERGCRYIVIADCGADPTPTFSDIGNVIRRCRVDFGTEIDLDTSAFSADPLGNASTQYVVGRIRFAPEHLRRPKEDWSSAFSGTFRMVIRRLASGAVAAVERERHADLSGQSDTEWHAKSRNYRILLTECGGEGGIRTHVPVTRQHAFEARPLRPLRYLSGQVEQLEADPDYTVGAAHWKAGRHAQFLLASATPVIGGASAARV